MRSHGKRTIPHSVQHPPPQDVSRLKHCGTTFVGPHVTIFNVGIIISKVIDDIVLNGISCKYAYYVFSPIEGTGYIVFVSYVILTMPQYEEKSLGLCRTQLARKSLFAASLQELSNYSVFRDYWLKADKIIAYYFLPSVAIFS